MDDGYFENVNFMKITVEIFKKLKHSFFTNRNLIAKTASAESLPLYSTMGKTNEQDRWLYKN